jgi:2-phospho-L-lactate guanylyltransferase
MRTAAVLPVKRFTLAKQRLGESVDDGLRLDLARAMVSDVLRALERTGAIERTIVVTNEESIADTARGLGATLISDSAESGQSAAVALGVALAVSDGIERVLCVPGDCPALDPAELEMLLAEPADRAGGAGGQVVIVPDRHGTGTNGLLLTPPTAIDPSYGPGSCARHAELARAAGAPCRLERPSSLLLDIDTGADLAALRERLAQARGGAERTRAVLGRAGGGDSLTASGSG